MYIFKKVYDQEDPFVTKVSEIRDLATVAEKAIDVIRQHYQYCPFWVAHVDVEGGVHERDTGFMEFDGGEYPYRKGEKTWADLLIEDFERDQKEKLVPGWFSYLNFSSVIFFLLAQSEPIVLQLERGELRVTLSYSRCNKYMEKKILDDLVAAFGMYEE